MVILFLLENIIELSNNITERNKNLAGLIATSKQDSEDLPFLMFSFEANREKLKDFSLKKFQGESLKKCRNCRYFKTL